MADVIDIRLRRDRRTPLDTLVRTVRETPLPLLIEAIVAVRDVPELVLIIDQLAAVIIHSTARHSQ